MVGEATTVTTVKIEVTESVKHASLHQKIAKGNIAEVQELIAFGIEIDINAQDENGNSPLCLAASCGDEDIINLLIQNKANISHKNNLGYTAFHLASLKQHWNAMKTLLEHGANVDDINKEKYTPLMNAAGRGDLQTVKFLTKRGARVNYSTKKGMTPLHKACIANSIEIVKHLISLGANVNKIRRNCSRRKFTPLEDAAANGHDQIMKCLVKNGAKFPKNTKYGYCMYKQYENGELRNFDFILFN